MNKDDTVYLRHILECIRRIEEDIWYFRVYEEGDKSKFVDYEFRHLDLEVRIAKDEMAAFYRDEDGNDWLDYSPEVLGLEQSDSDEK